MKMISFFPFFPVMDQQLNEIDKGRPKYSGINLSQCHFTYTNPTRTDLGSNPGLRGERLATNRLSHGTTKADSRHHNPSSTFLGPALVVARHVINSRQ
jgi:hypothetical protein